MEYKKRYKELFSQIQPTKEFDLEELRVKKPYRNITKKVVAIAATAALLAGLGLTAYAVNLFGLRDLLLPERQEVQLPVDAETEGEERPTYQADMISLTGYANTPESKALAEWQAFLNAYDQDGAIIDSIGNNPTGFEEEYGLYLVYTQEMADKLDEITAKYDLDLHTVMIDDLYTNEALCDQVGGDFLGENQTAGTYMYEDGTFHFDGEIDLEDYGHLDYQFQRCVRGSFTDIILNIVDVNYYTEWSYIAQSGVPVTLALAPHKALIIADLPDSFVTINVLAGTETSVADIFSNGPITAEDLERFADSFDFSVLTPARAADSAIERPTLEEVLGKPTAEEFARMTGMEEAEAQRFFAQFVALVEQGEREAVAKCLRYPVTVETEERTDTVETAEEFLPYYDSIFTDGLWESIMVNRYDKERSDLIAGRGMVGAAGDAIWFAKMEGDQPFILTIRNSEGRIVRQGGM